MWAKVHVATLERLALDGATGADLQKALGGGAANSKACARAQHSDVGSSFMSCFARSFVRGRSSSLTRRGQRSGDTRSGDSSGVTQIDHAKRSWPREL
eukprot:5358162-Pleurochrysis_carterae.AAC.1